MRTQVHYRERVRRFVVPTFFVLVLGLFSLGLLGAKGIDAGSGIVEVSHEHGMVDWSNGVIRAVGLGVPPDNAANATHSREMAKRAGRVVAYRNLLEIVEGIHVDSHTLVKNYMVESDSINTKVKGLVHGARVTEEKALPDGSYHVTVEMKLSGDFQGTVLPPREREPDPLDFAEAAPPVVEQKSQKVLVYTGLVVDAQGLDVKQAMAPKLLMEDGRVVYGSEWVDPEVVKQQTVVGYVNGIPNAKSHQRVISTPLVVKALRVDAANPSDLVISDADAQTIHGIPAHVAFLKKAKVLVVLK